jgi:hypothetical protein
MSAAVFVQVFRAAFKSLLGQTFALLDAADQFIHLALRELNFPLVFFNRATLRGQVSQAVCVPTKWLAVLAAKAGKSKIWCPSVLPPPDGRLAWACNMQAILFRCIASCILRPHRGMTLMQGNASFPVASAICKIGTTLA